MPALTFPPGSIWIPPQERWTSSSAPSSTSVTIDAIDDDLVLIFPIWKAGNIHKIYFATATVGTAGSIEIRIETVDATDGLPTGTLWATNTNVTVSVLATDDNVVKSGVLTADATVALGDIIAIRLKGVSGAVGTIPIRYLSSFSPSSCMFPYLMQDTANGSGKTGLATQNSGGAQIVVEYSDGTVAACPENFAWLGGSGGGLNFPTFNNSSNPDEIGIKIDPLGFGYRIVGFWAVIDQNTAADFDVRVYDDTSAPTSPLCSRSCDKDLKRVATGGNVSMPFTGTATIDANRGCRVVLRPSSATNLKYSEAQVNVANDLNALPFGSYIYKTSREKDAPGVWSDDTTKRPLMGVICDQILTPDPIPRLRKRVA